MKLISHRGNIVGPNPKRENTPSYIDTAILSGYEVEIDIRYINDKFYLGHDTPEIEINKDWILKRMENLWIHCKDISSADILSKLDSGIKYFCHTKDDFVLASTNNIWVHDLSMELTSNCIIPLLSKHEIEKYNGSIVYGVCTDFISFASYNLKQKGLL